MARAETSHAVATIPRYGDRFHPLCAVYSRRLLEGLRESLGAGHRKVMDGIRASATALGESIDAFDVESIVAAGCMDLRLPTSANTGQIWGTRSRWPATGSGT